MLLKLDTVALQLQCAIIAKTAFPLANRRQLYIRLDLAEPGVLVQRLTTKFKKWLAVRARSQARKHGRDRHRRDPRNRQRQQIVEAWTGDQFLKVRVEGAVWRPPSVLCFDSNPDATLRFFARWRDRTPSLDPHKAVPAATWLKEPRNGRGLKSIVSYSDFSGIVRISTAAAIVIAADYDRLSELIGSVPPTINLHEWSPAVFNKLFELGFFELLGLTEKVEGRYHDNGKTRTMKLLSGANAAGNEAAAKQLHELSALITEGRGLSDTISFALNSALDEAMINVARHAYPDDHNYQLRHVGKWWVTAEADRVEKKLTIVIYDQGASIPVTLPRKKFADALKDKVTRVIRTAPTHDFSDDSAYIAAAMTEGFTQTGEAFHGYGIPQMKELIDICGCGRLTIFSRGGRCEYEPGSNSGIKRSTYDTSVGGTLIEWVIQLPEEPNA